MQYLQKYIINNRGIVYGAALSGKEVFYKRIDSVENLDELKGSKYVQAKIMNTFEEAGKDLSEDRWILFSGTACHLDGLKS